MPDGASGAAAAATPKPVTGLQAPSSHHGKELEDKQHQPGPEPQQQPQPEQFQPQEQEQRSQLEQPLQQQQQLQLLHPSHLQTQTQQAHTKKDQPEAAAAAPPPVPAVQQVPAPWATSVGKETRGSCHAAANAAADLPTAGSVGSNFAAAAAAAPPPPPAAPGAADAAVRPSSVAAAARCDSHCQIGAGMVAAGRDAQAARSLAAPPQPRLAAACGDAVEAAGSRRQSSGATSTVATTYVRLAPKPAPAASDPAISAQPGTGAAAAAANAIEPAAKPRFEGPDDDRASRGAAAHQAAAAPGAEHQQHREQAKAAAPAATQGPDGARRPDAPAQGLAGAAAAAALPAAARAAPPPSHAAAAAAALPHPPSCISATAPAVAQPVYGAAHLTALQSPRSLRGGTGGGASFNVLSLLGNSSTGRRDSASLAPLAGTGSGLLSASGSAPAAAAAPSAAAAPTVPAPLQPVSAAAPPPAVRKEVLDRLHADMAELQAQAAARHAADLQRQEEQERLRQLRERERDLQLRHWEQQESLRRLLQQLGPQHGELARRLEAERGVEGGGGRYPVPGHGADGADGGGGEDMDVDVDMELDSPPCVSGGSGQRRQQGGGGEGGAGGARQRAGKPKGKLAWAKRVRAFLRRQPKRRATYGDVVRQVLQGGTAAGGSEAGMAIPDFVVPPDNYQGINRYLGSPFFQSFWRFVRTMKKGGGEFCVLEAVPGFGNKGPARKGADAAAGPADVDVDVGGGVLQGGGDGGAVPGDSAVAAAVAAASSSGGGGPREVPSTAGGAAAGHGGGPPAPGLEVEGPLLYVRRLYDYLAEKPDGLPFKELGRSPLRVPKHLLGGLGFLKWLNSHSTHISFRGGRLFAKPGQRP
ncbi:hypothetical protein PLESTF_000972500 [Pleodorina starrii]|nr:hypothetical protein PLESTF_000972500 [Pleodorina starrii]